MKQWLLVVELKMFPFHKANVVQCCGLFEAFENKEAGFHDEL